jgi:Holliday junction resolvase
MNAKKKGNHGENNWANWLTAQGIKCYRNSSSGANTQKSDVHNSINANFEVKTVKAISLKQAWKQTKRDSEMAHSIPYLIIHFDGMPQEDWLVVMSNHDWVELLTGEKVERETGKTTPIADREIKWAIENLKQAAAKVSKLLNKEL